MTPEKAGQLMASFLARAWESSPPPPVISPDELAFLAPILHQNGSSGLAWWRIRESEFRDHPQAPLLHDGFRQHTLRTRYLEKQLRDLLPFFRDRGIDPILGKGWGIGRLYPQPGLRPYGDLDFLIHPDQMEKARKAMSDPGRPEASVELHDNFRQLLDRSPEELVAQSRVETLGELEVRVLGPEDHLRLLALHGLCHGFWRPLWLCDLAVLLEWIEDNPEAFDWDLCIQGDGWRSEGVRCALGLARELLGADLEGAGVPAEWRNPPLPAWLMPAALRAWGTPDHYLHMNHPANLLTHPRQLWKAARLRWTNPMEATYRREAPWDDSPRLPYRLMDYLSRGLGFLRKAPRYLMEQKEREEIAATDVDSGGVGKE